MAKKTNTAKKTETVEVVTIDDLNEKKRHLQELLRLEKAQKKNQDWEAKMKKRNPAYVTGSLRPSTDKDLKILSHVHGWVCQIACQFEGCKVKRLINKQDAFQVKFCLEHKMEANKARTKARRQQKILVDMTPEKVNAEIERLQTTLAQLQD